MTAKERNKKYLQSEKGKLNYKKYQNAYRKTEKGKLMISRRTKQFRETVKGRALRLFTSAKSHAKRKNLLFTITQYDIEARLTQCQNTCEVTGTPLNFETRDDIKTNPFAPSLDQRKAGFGYTPENIQIVAWWYNRMKADLSEKEALQILIESHPGISHRYEQMES
jgi:hypothetical protein